MTEDPASGPALPPAPPVPAGPRADPAQAQAGPGPGLWSPTPAVTPTPAGPGPSRGWRTTLAVGGTMLALVIGVNLANAAIPLPEDPAVAEGPLIPESTFVPPPGDPVVTAEPMDPGPIADGERIDVGAGYSIAPPDGWSVISSDEDVKVLQKGAVLVVVLSLAATEPPEVLAAAYRDAWFADGSYTGGDPVDREVGNGLPAAEVDYTGLFEGTQVDGRIIVASSAGSGLVVNALAPSGALAGMDDDVESILASVLLGGG